MGAKGALGGGGLIALAAGAPPTWTVNASNTDNKSNNTSACWRRCRCCVEDIYQLQVKRHFWGADLATHQTTRQQTETTAPARLQPGSAESAVRRLQTRDYADHMAWVRLLAYSYLLTYSLTYLLTYLTPYLMSTITYLTPYLTPYSLTVLTTLPASSQATLLGYV